MSTAQSEFAFNTHEHAGVGCPATCADLGTDGIAHTEENRPLRSVQGFYDRIIRERMMGQEHQILDGNRHEGVVTREVARDAWFEAMQRAAEKHGIAAIHAGARVARRVGFFD